MPGWFHHLSSRHPSWHPMASQLAGAGGQKALGRAAKTGRLGAVSYHGVVAEVCRSWQVVAGRGRSSGFKGALR